MTISKFIFKVFFYFQVRIDRFKNYLFQMMELYRIEKFLKSKERNTLSVVWDLKREGVVIGDFIIFCFFLKYFQMKGKRIEIYIIYKKNEIRKSVKKKIHEESDKVIRNYWLDLKFRMAKKILNKGTLKLRLRKWDQINKKEINNKKKFLIFKEAALSRDSNFHYIFFIQNRLLKKENDNFMKKYLISWKNFKSDTSKKTNFFCRRIFYCLIIRNNKDKNERRELTGEDIVLFIQKFYKIKKKANLLIVSDKKGNNYVKKIIKKNQKHLNKNIKIFFNKDFSTSLFEDAYLLLKSKCTFSLPASGGIMCWLHYSKAPFLLAFYHSRILNYRLLLSNKYLHFFWKKKQVWVNSNNTQDLLKKMEEYRF